MATDRRERKTRFTAETPDGHVVALARQFLRIAVLARDHDVFVGASAIRVNAAFAIELFIKSLNCKWEHVEDDPHAVTTKSKRGHLLADLLAELPESIRHGLLKKFAARHADQANPSLEGLLIVYSNTFSQDRYAYERLKLDRDSRPVDEVVSLAEFFDEFVQEIPCVRHLVE